MWKDIVKSSDEGRGLTADELRVYGVLATQAEYRLDSRTLPI